MSEICVKFEDINTIDDIKYYLCKGSETPEMAINRIIVSELKSKKLMNDLKYGGRND